MKIKGGYILQPRIIQESDIMNASPCVREVWFYLLREANSSDNEYRGHSIKRGQLFRDYKTIRNTLSWNVGYRKEMYNENQLKKAMKFLRDTGRITTTKEPGGVLITISKYDYYQNPKNYERTSERTSERTIDEPMTNQPVPTNNKNKKKEKNDKKKGIANSENPPRQKKYSTELFNKMREMFEAEYKNQTGNDYYWTAGDSGSLSGIITKLFFRVRSKNRTEVADPELVMKGWEMILRNLPEFYQSEMDVKVINSKFNAISAQITEAYKKKKENNQVVRKTSTKPEVDFKKIDYAND